jgi:hypothetical protein
MRTHLRKTAQLGELVVAAFDEAARYSTDPREVSRLATQAVAHMLRRARWSPLAQPPQAFGTKASVAC